MADDTVADMKGTDQKDLPTPIEGQQPPAEAAKGQTEDLGNENADQNVAAPGAGGEEE